MNNITKKKSKIMEGIIHSNAALDSNDIKWINSHLPDDVETEGKNVSSGLSQLSVLKFDHTQGDVIKAINPNYEPKVFISELNKKIRRHSDGMKLSQSVEKAIQDYSAEELAFLIYLGVRLSKD